MAGETEGRLSYGTILELKRWSTPSVYNGWEAITACDRTRGHFNSEATRDYMPELGPIVGYAVTVITEPSNAKHHEGHEVKWREYRAYIASRPEPKIVVVQDLDKPHFVGAYWGEVMSNVHRALGCVGTIIDGAIRDVDEMRSVGFKALAKQTTVGHAYSTPIQWGCEVEVFGCSVRPGQLIHADQHGFLVVPEQDEAKLLEACRFMDTAECHTLISGGRKTAGRSIAEVLQGMEEGMREFNSMVTKRFADGGA